MAKKKKFVKLGEKASIFFDPTSRLKVVPGKAYELSVQANASKRVRRALKAGHIEYASKDEDGKLEFVALSVKVKKAQEQKQEDKADELDPDEVDYSLAALKRLNKPQLVALALEIEGIEEDEDELKDLNKEPLIDLILEMVEDEDEEDDEDE